MAIVGTILAIAFCRQTMSTAWQQPEYPSQGPAMNGFGGVAAPVLGGFSLGTIVALLNVTSVPIPQREFAIVAFSLTTVTMVFCIQFTYLATAFWALPSEGFEWSPEARRSYRALERLVQRQRTAMSSLQKYGRVADGFFQVGSLALFVGVGAVLWPTPGDWRPSRILALAIVALGAVLELTWTAAYSPGRLGRPLRELSAAAMLGRQPRYVLSVDIDAETVGEIAEPAFRDGMLRDAAHPHGCAAAPLEQLESDENGMPVSFRGLPLQRPVTTLRGRDQNVALYAAGVRVLVVLSDHVVVGCVPHVMERLRKLERDSRRKDQKQIKELLTRLAAPTNGWAVSE